MNFTASNISDVTEVASNIIVIATITKQQKGPPGWKKKIRYAGFKIFTNQFRYDNLYCIFCLRN